MQNINILDTKPTFDLTDFEITNYDKEHSILFCQSKQIFQFDKCKGTITNNSRVLLEECSEAVLVESVIGGVIHAGFTGKLYFKIKLTKRGLDLFSSCLAASGVSDLVSSNKDLGKYFDEAFQVQLSRAVQIDLAFFPNNYCDKDNSNFQEDLAPDVRFFCQNETYPNLLIFPKSD